MNRKEIRNIAREEVRSELDQRDLNSLVLKLLLSEQNRREIERLAQNRGERAAKKYLASDALESTWACLCVECNASTKVLQILAMSRVGDFRSGRPKKCWIADKKKHRERIAAMLVSSHLRGRTYHQTNVIGQREMTNNALVDSRTD